MSVTFITNDPEGLLEKFKTRIKQTSQKGQIRTWELDEDGDFTHSADDWRLKAYFHPEVKDDRLVFYIHRYKPQAVKTIVYGYYHGHLIETFLNHFDKDFSEAHASALAVAGDNV